MKNLRNYLTIAIVAFGLSTFAQDKTIDIKNSDLKWAGAKVGGKHWGGIDLKSGSLKLEKNKIVGGEFTIDMKSITCGDLEGEWNQKLVGHLKSDDFFGVEKFPTATLKITEASPFKSGKASVKGKLTIKGKTHPVEFAATKADMKYTASIVIDRTLYDVRYGSGKFFENLGDKAIDDEFTLDVNLVVK